jgi:hypothetical protein
MLGSHQRPDGFHAGDGGPDCLQGPLDGHQDDAHVEVLLDLGVAADMSGGCDVGSQEDASVLPLRPGTLLVHESINLDALPAPLPRWDAIRYQWPGKPIEAGEDGVPLLASQSIGMNVLSLDEQRVIVQDIQLPLIRSLESKGFTPVPLRWRRGRSLGGGFHCVTLDVRRDGQPDFSL